MQSYIPRCIYPGTVRFVLACCCFDGVFCIVLPRIVAVRGLERPRDGRRRWRLGGGSSLEWFFAVVAAKGEDQDEGTPPGIVVII